MNIDEDIDSGDRENETLRALIMVLKQRKVEEDGQKEKRRAEETCGEDVVGHIKFCVLEVELLLFSR